jgi:hypothetical protein
MGIGVRRLALIVRPHVDRHRLALTPLVGLLVGILAVGYAATTGNPTTDVLFSGQSALGPLLANSAGYPLGALLMLLLCKGLAYALSLSSFRGGPIFPAMFLGAAGGIALSHLPGLPAVAGAAMGIAAMSTVMLKLPMTSVLLATLLLTADGLRHGRSARTRTARPTHSPSDRSHRYRHPTGGRTRPSATHYPERQMTSATAPTRRAWPGLVSRQRLMLPCYCTVNSAASPRVA